MAGERAAFGGWCRAREYLLLSNAQASRVWVCCQHVLAAPLLPLIWTTARAGCILLQWETL